MFEHDNAQPRIFGQPLGSDFPKAVVSGIKSRMANCPAEDLSKVVLIVNTARMRRRIQKLFSQGAAGFLPRIVLLSDLEHLLLNPPPPPARAPLQRRLQLAELLAPILKDRPELAPKSSLFALADSLAQLMDEMQGEGVGQDEIDTLDVSDESGHWRNAKTLIAVAQSYVRTLDDGIDSEARQRLITQQLIAQWEASPPKHPVLLAGSTGSRGTTFMLMQAVAGLSQGALILPGFDTDLPDNVWQSMSDALKYEDHPQFRFAKLMQCLEVGPHQIEAWAEDSTVPQDRNKVVSLALRPAPVTDAWLSEGNDLPEIPTALAGLTLLEAPTQRVEALAIAVRLRLAAESGQTAALITPDRMLGRQVAAALDRWNIVPDDSGGAPLHLSAPGRFLRHISELFHQPFDAEILLTLLKHPLTQSGECCPSHGLYTQRLELQLRRDNAPFPDEARLAALVEKAARDRPDAEDMIAWGAWIQATFCGLQRVGTFDLSDHLAELTRVAERAANGATDGSGDLWNKSAGKEALVAMGELEACVEHGGPMTAAEFSQLLASVFTQHEVRDQHEPHPNIMIWGTLEARVQGADLVILGGLNDGVWPEAVTADPWLNRRMRHEAGLLLPDRRVGLSAHDFQQAVAAPEVWLTRAIRSEDAETVPSRWINRLTNMISGLPERGGPEALENMRDRGANWLQQVAALEAVSPVEPAKRAAPVPPVDARPRDFSVTEIKTLIRDPYAIYARHCLGLRELDPLVQQPDAPIRGIVIHEIMERFIARVLKDRDDLTTGCLLEETDFVLAEHVPWPTERMMWRARMARVARWVVETETSRLARGTPAAMEDDAKGHLPLTSVAGSIRARADRIDTNEAGEALLYDYKSGTPPTPKQQKTFDKQLLIEAAMIEEGAFGSLGVRAVQDAVYIGLSASPKEQPAPLDKVSPAQTLAELKDLIAAYLDPDQHYLSRRAPRSEREYGSFDHLARHGEWDDMDPPSPEDVS